MDRLLVVEILVRLELMEPAERVQAQVQQAERLRGALVCQLELQPPQLLGRRALLAKRVLY